MPDFHLRRQAPGLLLIVTIAAAATSLTAFQSSSAHGIDLAGMDTSVPPGTDFFRYANGTWDRTTPIPNDRAGWGTGAEIAQRTSLQTRELLEGAAKAAPGTVERKAGDYYAAYMDDATIERRGLTPVQPLLTRLAAITDRRTLSRELGSMLRADTDPLNATNYYTDHLFGLFVAQDFNDPTRNTAYLMQGGLGMPDREYYLSDAPQMASIRQTYQEHIAALLHLAGANDDESASQAARVMALETSLARAHWSREDSGDLKKTNTKWTRADFASKAPGLDWSTYFAAAGLEQQQAFIAWQSTAITGESALVASASLDDWKLYLRYLALNHWGNLLPRAFADEQFHFYGTTLSGTPTQSDRWKRGIGSTNGALGDAVGRIYADKYFPPASKRAVESMVTDIKNAFRQRINALDWMTASTKAAAARKLDTLIVAVGYPETWRNYSTLTISKDDALGNAMRAEEWEFQHQRGKLSKPVDRREWWMTPQTVNAVNLPIQNALNFPAAILQAPNFDPQAPSASNYGAIGAVIGHEVSHSFDNSGSEFDAEGRMTNWWSPDDFAHFTTASEKLVAQYNAYKPLPDLALNGKQTLGENLADLAGLSAAYDAYRLSLHGAPAPEVGGFTGDQQFFIAYAQSWRDKYRDPLLRRLVIADGHAPSPFRTLTVRNLDAWYAAFSVPNNAPLFLAPADRVRIW
ncbi:MAG: M13 family metallopeptidase [Vicinamibacterales bacterium]